MQAHLAAAPQCQAMRRYYYRNTAVPQPHRCALKLAYGHIQFIILLFGSKHKDQAHIGARAKVGAVIGYH